MPSQNRRAAARRRAWGRGPIILRFEPLEGRQLLAARASLPDLAGIGFNTSVHNATWGGSLTVTGQILNQGNATASQPFHVEILASSTPKLGPTSLVLGDFTVAAGLAPNQTASYTEQVTLPPTPIPGFTVGKPIYIASLINPGRALEESNYHNDSGVGLGNDTAALSIVQQQPSQLMGSSFAVSPNTVSWGQQVTVTAQIRNNAQGDAPATRAAIILTPSGTSPGNGQDVTVGYLNVPAVPAWQTVNVVQTITLPSTPAPVLANTSQFTISMIQDADYVTNQLYPHEPSQGAGLDSTQIVIGLPSNTNTTPTTLPDIAAGTVQAPSPIHWGQDFQVTASIQNVGQADAGPFNVDFLLTGASGALTPAIYLGSDEVSGLAAGATQTLVPTLHIPGEVPASMSIDSLGIGRIVMAVDPANDLNETVKTNNVSVSNPVTLRLLGADGTTTVPTAPAPNLSLGQPQPQGTLQALARAKANAQANPSIQAAREQRAQARLYLRLHRKATPTHHDLVSKVENRLKVFPKQIGNAFSNLFK